MHTGWNETRHDFFGSRAEEVEYDRSAFEDFEKNSAEKDDKVFEDI